MCPLFQDVLRKFGMFFLSSWALARTSKISHSVGAIQAGERPEQTCQRRSEVRHVKWPFQGPTARCVEMSSQSKSVWTFRRLADSKWKFKWSPNWPQMKPKSKLCTSLLASNDRQMSTLNYPNVWGGQMNWLYLIIIWTVQNVQILRMLNIATIWPEHANDKNNFEKGKGAGIAVFI